MLVSGLASAHAGDPIEAIVFACLGTAVVPVDATGRPLGAALAPADARPMQSPGVAGQLGLTEDVLRHLTGSDPRIASSLLHILWWRREHPEVMERLHRFRSLRGYLVQQLCAADVEDPSWASRTMILDLATTAWSAAILEAADLSAEMLPAIAPSTASWPVEPAAARRFGLSPRAVVVLGGMDNGCSLLGATDPGEPSLANIVGTYEHMAGAASLDVARCAAAAAGGLVHAYPLPGRYVGMTRVPIGDLLAEVAKGSPSQLDRLLDDVSAVPRGHRVRLDARMVREALAAGTSPATVLQGLLESAAAVLGRFADAWESALHEPAHVAAVGGGALRTNLLQLKANVVGRPFSTLACDEGAGMGALRLAAMAVLGVSPGAACELFANPVARTIGPGSDAPAVRSAANAGRPVE